MLQYIVMKLPLKESTRGILCTIKESKSFFGAGMLILVTSLGVVFSLALLGNSIATKMSTLETRPSSQIEIDYNPDSPIYHIKYIGRTNEPVEARLE